MDDARSESRTELSRRRFLRGALGTVVAAPAVARRAGAQARPTITYWNGLTGADGKVMDELIDQFTRETGIKVDSSGSSGPTSTRSCRCRCPPARDPTWC